MTNLIFHALWFCKCEENLLKSSLMHSVRFYKTFRFQIFERRKNNAEACIFSSLKFQQILKKSYYNEYDK